MNNSKIMDGRKIKKEIFEELKERVDKEHICPSFTVIQVGDNPSSNIYIRNKLKMAEYIGYDYNHIKLPLDVDEEYIIKEIDRLNNDNKVDGIMIQMPLPKTLNTSRLLNRIDPKKDIDGLTDYNSGLLFHDKDALYSCTPLGIIEILKRYNISIEGKHVTIVGRSNLVGKPLSMMILNKGATVTICHSKTKNLKKHTQEADILIACCGVPNIIKKDMVKENSVIIDVGITKIDNKIYGDVDYDDVIDKVSYITPVPGGIGQMTVALLATNIMKAYDMKRGSQYDV